MNFLYNASCCDKDCIEDLRFYPKLECVDAINRALSVKGGTAKLLYVYVDVEPVSFNRASTPWICGFSTPSPCRPISAARHR